jgi:hypothetical protein
MGRQWGCHPQIESLESMELPSTGLSIGLGPRAFHHRVAPVPAVMLNPMDSGSPVLAGTLRGTFFAHKGNPATGVVYSLFSSGKVESLGPTLQVGGFETSGFSPTGEGGGNLILSSESSHRGVLYIRLVEVSGPVALNANSYIFSYAIIQGSGATRVDRGTGTVAITLQPAKTNIRGEPLSNPGFFGNSTLTFVGPAQAEGRPN